MFTGIIIDVGRVRDRRDASGRDLRLEIETRLPLDTVAIGASIACSGVCLTVVEKGADWFAVDVSGETRARSTADRWRVGSALNLEPSLKIGDELGGHLVYGHVDGRARVIDVTPEGGSERWRFEAPADLARFIAEKGSVALDGVSLTVNAIEGAVFGVNIIPHTRERTTFSELRPGDPMNLEVDIMARYAARLAEAAR